MINYRRLLRLATGLFFVAGPVLLTTTAHAQGRVQGSLPAPLVLPFSPATPHCVIQLAPLLPGQASSVATSLGCYATFSAAISAATGGRVHLAPNINGSNLTQDMLQPKSSGPGPLANVCDPGCGGTVIGLDFWDASYQGDSITYTTNNSVGCAAGANYYFSYMPSGWNDQVSSAHSYQQCWHFEHFYDVGFGQPMFDCNPACTSMGAANDQTSSVALKYNS